MRIILLLIFIVTGLQMTAQNVAPIISTPSPNTLAFGRFGENPVSYHNGTVQVNIPIYTLKEGPIELPVSLMHHGEGSRPDVHPGWAGMDWALNAGGMISRVVKGVPDETTWDYAYAVPGLINPSLRIFDIGQIYNNILGNANWSQTSYIENYAKIGTEYNRNVSQYWQEAEPDEFRFNFCGYSGSFFVDENKIIRVIGDPGIRVEIEDTLIAMDYNRYITGNFPFTYSQTNFFGSATGLVNLVEYKIRGRKITLPNGLQYEFGLWNSWPTGDDPIERSVNFFQQVDNNESWDTWHLKRIISPGTGHYIDFSYVSAASGMLPVAHFNRVFAMDQASGSSTPRGIWKIFGSVSASSSSIMEYFDGRIIMPAYLSKITTSSQQITINTRNSNELKYNYDAIVADLELQANSGFDRSILDFAGPRFSLLTYPTDVFAKSWSIPGYYAEFLNFGNLIWQRLYSIEVKDLLHNKSIQTTEFSFSNDSNKRLTLLGLKQYGTSAEGAKQYSFKYDDSLSLPPYNTYKTDHWGFYNGKAPTVGNLTPTELANFTNFKEPDFSYAKAGSLIEITYPTGGSTQFTYEGHSVSKMVQRDESTGAFTLVNQNRSVGGLRIKTIRDYSITGEVRTRNFSYEGGICGGTPKYYWPNFQGKLANGNVYTSTRFVTQTIVPMSANSIGSHVGYSKVTESETGNGATEYVYSNYDILDDNYTSSIEVTKSLVSPFSSKHRERGLLLEVKKYKQEGASLVPVSHVINSYPQSSSRFNNYIRAVNQGSNSVLSGVALYGSAYKTYNYPFPVSTVNETTMGGGNSLSVTTSFQYDAYNQIKTQSFTNEKNQIVSDTFKYPHDYAVAPYTNMSAANMRGYVVERTRTVGTTQTEWLKTDFYTPLPGMYLAKEVKEQFGSGSPKQLALFNQYDAKGNPADVTKSDGIRESYVWGYKNKYPVLKAVNAAHDEIAYLDVDGKGVSFNSRFESPVDFEQSYDPQNGYYFDLADQIGFFEIAVNLDPAKTYVLSYWENNVDMPVASSYTLISDKILKTEGDWRLREIIFTDLSGSIYMEPYEGLIRRVMIYPVSSQVSTYTYSQAVGMTSETDNNNNRSTFYEYDDQNRLYLIKDDQKNILKKFDYQYQAPNHTSSIWELTGQTRCKPCAANPQYTIDMLQREEIDNNPQSVSYRVKRWIDANIPGNCVIAPGWQNTTTAIRCKKNGSNQNTGEQEQERRDMNPCSPTYNTLQWFVTGTNYTSCPMPNVMVTGTNTTNKVITLSYKNTSTNVVYTFNLPVGASNAQLGTVPNGTYTVNMVPVNWSTSYPVLFTLGSSTQNYYATVAFGGQSYAGNVSHCIAAPAPVSPVIAWNSRSVNLKVKFTGITNPAYVYEFIIPAGTTASGGTNFGVVPSGFYNITMEPSIVFPGISYLYKLYGFTQTYYATVLFGNVEVIFNCTLALE